MLTLGKFLASGSRKVGHLLRHMVSLDMFLQNVRITPKILVDGGPWYKPALKRLGVDWEHVTFGLRNPIEQWFGILKHRITLFYNRWPHNASVESAQAWINAFVSMYHLRRC
ncbi:MAG: hypothetical protein DRN08_03465 [Thermoplasmata archaeon]|nr:MAG: hypothetical protein DRN05_03615 [Thermoplasmata archaeon]RLF35187.1 MAG: hypothetical protein DRN08_03465 [Thermoplasmata archaeon]